MDRVVPPAFKNPDCIVDIDILSEIKKKCTSYQRLNLKYCDVIKLTLFIGSLHLFLRWLGRRGVSTALDLGVVSSAGISISDCGG